jgi:hypothetical protein
MIVVMSFGKNTCEGCMSMLAFQHCPRSQGKYKQLLLPAFCCLRFCHNISLMKMPLKTYQFVVLFVNDGEVGQAESAGIHKNKYWLLYKKFLKNFLWSWSVIPYGLSLY